MSPFAIEHSAHAYHYLSLQFPLHLTYGFTSWVLTAST